MKDIFPSIEQAVDMEREELAVFLLCYLADAQPDMMRLDNFLLEFDAMMMPDKRTDHSQKIEQALTEAWLWLDKEIMFAPRMLTETQYITRRGHELLEHADLDAYKRSALLREMPLDSVLARKVMPTYMRGDYDTAVFQAYKEVEIRVRTACGYGNDKYGKPLMHQAFQVDSGPLTDLTIEQSERDGMRDLFVACIGLLKNPASHRDTELDDPGEAAEAILFANYLLRIVDRRAASLNRTNQAGKPAPAHE